MMTLTALFFRYTGDKGTLLLAWWVVRVLRGPFTHIKGGFSCTTDSCVRVVVKVGLRGTK